MYQSPTGGQFVNFRVHISKERRKQSESETAPTAIGNDPTIELIAWASYPQFGERAIEHDWISEMSGHTHTHGTT